MVKSVDETEQLLLVLVLEYLESEERAALERAERLKRIRLVVNNGEQTDE